MGMAAPQKLLLVLQCSGLMCCSPPGGNKPVLGVIGCMAERLKSRLFEEKAVDIIAGPDALRSVPGLIDLFCQVNTTGRHFCCNFALSPHCWTLWQREGHLNHVEHHEFRCM